MQRLKTPARAIYMQGGQGASEGGITSHGILSAKRPPGAAGPWAAGPQGPSPREAASPGLARQGKNKLKEGKESWFQRFLQQMADPMIIVLLAAAAAVWPDGRLRAKALRTCSSFWRWC